MRTNSYLHRIILLWLAWAAIMIGFQHLVPARFQPQRPDYARPWTANETRANSQKGKPYLLDPFMNAEVSWDSEFYLSTATVGYDDPAVHAIAGPGGRQYSLNYAFFPAYPFTMRLAALPLRLLPMTPIARFTLAGVLVSLLGTLGALLALFDLGRDELGDAGAFWAAFYLLIFPSGFFLAQVYTEGLFAGLAFGSLAMLRRKQWLWAALLAALATWTRAVGLALVVPLVLAWLNEARAKLDYLWPMPLELLIRGLLCLVPFAAYLVWRLSFFGRALTFIDEAYFSRQMLAIGRSLVAWAGDLAAAGGNSQAVVYYSLELGAIGLAIMACTATWRRYPGVTLFGLIALAIAVFSGAPQSMVRYMLVVPSIYLFLGRLGRHEAFDRGWTVASTLLMGMLATLFTFDMWVA